MATETARRERSSSNHHLDATRSKILESRLVLIPKASKSSLKKPVVDEEGLVAVTEDKLALEEKRTQVLMKFDKVTAGAKQAAESKRKEKIVEERCASEMQSVKYIYKLRAMKERSKGIPQGSLVARKNLENRSGDVYNKPLPEPEKEAKGRVLSQLNEQVVVKKHIESATAGVKQPSHQSRTLMGKKAYEEKPAQVMGATVSAQRKKTAIGTTVSAQEKKTAVGATVSAQNKEIGGKNLKDDVSSVANQPLPKIRLKRYEVEMDPEEYENLEVFKSHTCTPKCIEYIGCEFKKRAVVSHFKEFLNETLGRGGPEQEIRLCYGLTFFKCYLSEEEAGKLRGQKGAIEIELYEPVLGHHGH